MTHATERKSGLGLSAWLVIVSSVVFAVLNVISIAKDVIWMIEEGANYSFIDAPTSVLTVFGYLNPLNYLAILLLVSFRKPKFAFIPTSLLALATIYFYYYMALTSQFGDVDWTWVLPIVSLSNAFDWTIFPWPWINGLEPIFVLSFFVLLNFCPTNTKMKTSLQTIRGEITPTISTFCSKCGSKSSGDAFCSVCGNKLAELPYQPAYQFTVPHQSTTVPKQSTLAVIAFIVSFIVSFIGLILGYVARREIKDSGGSLTGDGLATAAIVIGWVWTGLATVIGIVWVFTLTSASVYGY